MRPVNPRRLAGAALVALAAAAACTNKITPPEPEAPVQKKAVTPDSVQSIFTANCVDPGCHSGTAPQQGMRLEVGFSYENIVNVESMEQPPLKRIEPGSAANSYLVRKIDGDPSITGAQMPRFQPPLDPAVRQVIRNWADAGAPADSVPLAPTPFLTD